MGAGEGIVGVNPAGDDVGDPAYIFSFSVGSVLLFSEGDDGECFGELCDEVADHGVTFSGEHFRE